MDSGVIAKLRMECCSHDSSLPYGDRVGTFGGYHFNACAYAFNFGGADEDHLQRRAVRLIVKSVLEKFAFADGAVNLASVGIAADADVDRAEPFLCRIFNLGGE